MYKKRRSYSRTLAFMLALIMVVTLVPQTTFAGGDGNNDYPDSEWWNFRNNEDNNGVTDKATPVNTTTAYLKWGKKYGTSYSNAVAPPIIVGGCLYTATQSKVLKIDRATGELITSAGISGSFGYAMNPIVYAEGKLFLQIGKIGSGMVEALDVNTLESLWVSESLGGQTLCPITYKNGYIYTGTWNSETKDGAYVSISASATEDVTEGDDGTKTKKYQWILEPSKGVTTRDGVSSAGGVETPRGFYWAGAYAAENFVVFGSDDGSASSNQTETGVLYSMHPTSGAVIATLGGIKGDIRTTMVHHDGYLYFATKGSYMYKVKINEDGTFGNCSYIDTGGAMTASPVVHNGRIYLGISGASQFDPDSNHVYAVISDEGELSRSSLLYTVPIPGYPQAAALLSTQDEKTTGDVYLYFAYNANPGGIYCLKDNGEKNTGSAFSLFTPPKDMQQYCISTICSDNNGTLYYKNDSGYLMAVEYNDAYVEDITVTPNTGTASWNKNFDISETDYSIKVPSNSTSCDIELMLPDGVSAKVNDTTFAGKYTCDLSTGQAELKIVTQKGDKSRTYTLAIICESRESALSDLVVTHANSPTSTVLDLKNTFTSTAINIKTKVYDGTATFARIWPVTANADATVSVHPVANVSNSDNDLNEDGTIAGKHYSSGNRYYYPVYYTDYESYSKVRIDVTSEDGSSITSYYLTIFRSPSVSGSRMELNKTDDEIYAKGIRNTTQLTATLVNATGSISWESDDPSIAEVDNHGLVTGISTGTTVIRADNGTISAECKITVLSPTITLSAKEMTIYKAKTKNHGKITAKVNGVANQTVNWSVTSGSDKASVDRNGIIKAKKAGSAIISAEINGVKAACKVTVKAAKFALKTTKKTLKRGKKYTIKIKTNEPKGKVTYKSKNKKIATVSSKGVIKARKKGVTYITVKCNGISKKFKVIIK